MREDLIDRLNEAWRKLYGDGDEHGVCDMIAEAAAALEAAREDAADAMDALRVAVLALANASECNPVYMPAYIHVSNAIEQARGKEVQDEA